MIHREVALLIIIMRAGLELDPVALKKLGFMVAKLLFIPLATESAIITVTTHFLFDLPWLWGVLMA